jgi:type 1 glutamine amidotransferase
MEKQGRILCYAAAMRNASSLYISSGVGHPTLRAQLRAYNAVREVTGGSLRWVHRLRALTDLNPEYQKLCIGNFHHKPDHPEIVDALDSYVGSGGAFLALHGVSASFKRNGRFEQMLGGVFTGHDSIQELALECGHDGPSQSEVATTVIDEPYEHRVAGEIQVICRWKKTGPLTAGGVTNEPCAWQREYGRGRVGYLSLGHRSAVWDNPAVRSILRELISWLTKDATQ